jgi:lysophospholipase L1-like esterase
MKAFAKALTTTVIFFVLLEIGLRSAYFVRNSMVRYVPLPYAVGDDYGPMPPWLDSLEILENDRNLIWKTTPNIRQTYLDVFSPVRTQQDRIALLRRFIPSVPAEFRANPTWDIQINSDGYRGGEMSHARAASTVRIACIGDSWTFGMPVGQNQTYPSRLAAWLHQEHPETKYDVQNFGVLGYSSFQGLRLLKARVLDFNPDVVVIGFGMNDSEVPGYRDKDVIAAGQNPRMTTRLAELSKTVANDLEGYKLLKYEALVLRFKPKPIGEYLKAKSTSQGADTIDYDGMEPWTRVSPHDFELNIREMIRLAAERGASAVLVDNELWAGSPYRTVLKRIAGDLEVPLVDSLAIVNATRSGIEQALESQLNLTGRDGELPPPPQGKTTVVFRAYRGSAAVPQALSIVGADPQLGALTPNRVRMRDDGLEGDQRAGDGVWSYAASFEPSKGVSYMYTNSGTPGEWEGLDVPYVRRVEIPQATDGRPVYLPIDTFGRVYMQGDGWHTDAVGYDAIAHAVERALTSNK